MWTTESLEHCCKRSHAASAVNFPHPAAKDHCCCQGDQRERLLLEWLTVTKTPRVLLGALLSWRPECRRVTVEAPLVATARLAFPAAPGQVQAQLRGRFHKKPKSQSCDPPYITVWQGGSPVLAPYVCLSGRRNKLLHLLPFSCISGATKEASPKLDP